MKNWWLLLVGFFAGLWWSERQKNEALEQQAAANTLTPAQSPVEPRKSRTLEEISPTYAANRHPVKELHGIVDDDLHSYATGVAREMVRPDLTELEAKLVADYLGKTILDATLYFQYRKSIEEERTQPWILEALEAHEEDMDDEA